jgi:tetraacyldisaccharide 4'-kinase
MSAQSWLNRIWYVRDAPPPWLLPLEGVFDAGTRLRRWLYRKNIRGSVRLSRPVVVVGNLTVGGTGKTPVVCWLVERLKERGYKPGVVTRGYGGSNRVPRLVRDSDDAMLVGDEPLLLVRRTGVLVAVGRERPAAAQMLVDAGCDVIVSDDGLQHYALSRDCEIVVIDAERGFGNGHLLPAGPLREAQSRLASVDAIVVNGAGTGTAGGAAAAGEPWGVAPQAGAPQDVAPQGGGVRPIFGMRLQATQAVSLRDSSVRNLREFSGQEVHAVAGIGNPQRFFRMLRTFGIQVRAHELPDHAVLNPKDIEFGDGRPVLMTEKDAVKCAGFAGAQHWCVPASVSFETDGGAQFLEIVSRCLASRCDATRAGATRSMNKPAEGNHG